jgi:hypothetical protein
MRLVRYCCDLCGQMLPTTYDRISDDEQSDFCIDCLLRPGAKRMSFADAIAVACEVSQEAGG